MRTPILLYSTNSWLAYTIAERYYGQLHYVWCSLFRGPGSVSALDAAVPPSSSPLEIYRALAADVARGDLHSAKIAENRLGLLRGVEAKLAVGVIDAAVASEIKAILASVAARDFRPILYVIPFGLVSAMAGKVPVERRAHPLSEEYIIDALPHGSFDTLEFPV
jgi:hypothetical protein